jgi:hypothetical protein
MHVYVRNMFATGIIAGGSGAGGNWRGRPGRQSPRGGKIIISHEKKNKLLSQIKGNSIKIIIFKVHKFR